ncbi:TIGR03862 family flavoprotein [Thiomicrospira microaerophila]|uniref:TIGR03862 family flavoprotein n=1 Tax=Thiomicrospira microaerophila TaxID=406020 RepID=UPI00200BB3BB|nr:TIGR03862 family flavoprotein [Thiomicrospira microaerophila]UQB42524.1 TIGR03862 family flavoprotein [Thiomicrospira microaerophila]
MKQIAIIGGGPGGLMAAEILSKHPELKVTIYDAMPSVGRKFLQAGRGGLNITHAQPLEDFLAAYGTDREKLESWILDFPPHAVRAWVEGFGISTFVGSSGRVYPQDMKAAPLLRAWLRRLRRQGVDFSMRYRWQGWYQKSLVFHTPLGEKLIEADRCILALGGASWPNLGSNGEWVKAFSLEQISPFLPANCGFDVSWSPVFKERFAGQPLKSVRLEVKTHNNQAWLQKGECLITEQGIEGSLIYALSRPIRDALLANESLQVSLDLMPDCTAADLLQRLAKPRTKLSLSNVFKRAGIDAIRLGLLREKLTPERLHDPVDSVALLKCYPLTLLKPRPVTEAISSAGGLKFDSLTPEGEISGYPGCFAVGEMLDWEAPTGGYLLTAVLAQARFVSKSLLNQLGLKPTSY